MDTIHYEFKHPKGGESAYVTHDKYSNGDEEFLAHVPGERVTRHATFEKAQKRLATHGYGNHEQGVTELGDVPVQKSYRSVTESFEELIESSTPSKVSHRSYSWGNLVTVGNVNSSVILHPEHMEKIKALGDGEQTQFTDETNTKWTATRDGNHVKFHAPRLGTTEHTVSLSKLTQSPASIDESAAPGQEDWIIANKKNFIDQYGKKKGLEVLYATAWKRHNEKLNESQLDEMVMDVLKHPVHGKVEWRNDGGAHMITTKNPSGSLNVHALGSHKEIASKWAQLKDKLITEDAEWV